MLDTLPPTGAAADTFTYDPADPTPYLMDSRELEESLNEDYTALNASRPDALVFTSRPLTRPLEVTGEMSATLWASRDARDTDWSIMLLDVWPDGHAERVQDGLVRARFRRGMDREVPWCRGGSSATTSTGASPAGQHRVCPVPQVRPEPEHWRQQRAGFDVRGGAPAGAARRGAPVARGTPAGSALGRIPETKGFHETESAAG